MIIYGSRAVHLASAQPTSVACPSCGTQGSLVISTFRRHAHIFWIPLFPIGKTGVSQCQHCKQVMKVKEMPNNIRKEYEYIKDEKRGPLWQFAGLGLIAVLVTWGSIATSQHKELVVQYLAAPVAGDVYEYKAEVGHYSTFKIVGVTQDSVYVSPNEYETNKVTGVDDIDKEENYSDEIYGMARKDIDEMYQQGEIYDIHRR